MPVKKTTPLRVLNPILAFLILVQFGTVLAAELFPQIYFFGIHKINGYLVGLVILLHLFFNRAWIKTSYFSKKPKSAE